MPPSHKFSQNQKFQQRMALTPQMRQSLELLTMPVKELSEYIESILEKNPFLKKEFDKKRNVSRLPEMTGEPQMSAKEDPQRSAPS